MELSTPRRPLIVLGLAGLALTFTACESASEDGIEQLVESQGDGDVDIDLDGGDGFSVETEDGSMTVDEDGNFVVTDGDGSVVTGNADTETGEVKIESEDGSFSSGATTELPDEWPADVPEPDGLAITSASVIGSDTEQAINVTGTIDGDGFVESYGAALESAGFNEDSTFESDGTISNTYSNDNWTVGVVSTGSEGERQVNVSIYSQ